MLTMTTPIVTELPLRMQAVTADSFLDSEPESHTHDRVMNYVECDLAAELTLPQWRRARADVSSRGRHSLRRRLAPVRRSAALAA
jgi:hypothetical protein